jgi:thymidylate synthase
MIETFSGSTADTVWQQMVQKLTASDGGRPQPSKKGMTLELLHAGITITDPRQRWIVSRVPPLNPAFAIAEVVWILNGRNDAAFLNYWNKRLPEYSGKGSEYHGAYGYRLRQHLKMDQLERACSVLGKDPDSRQVVLQLWDSTIDMPKENGDSMSMDIPCNVLSMLKVRESKLEWTQIMRSNDVFLGFPYNVIQFTTLQEVMAGWLNLGVGSYNHFSDSLHAYLEKVESIKNSVPIHVERNNDSLALPRQDSEPLLKDLANRIEQFTKNGLTKEQHQVLSSWNGAPVSFQNLLSVVAAEGARKNRWTGLASEIMSNCSNPVLCQLWQRWESTRGQGTEEIICNEPLLMETHVC